MMTLRGLTIALAHGEPELADSGGKVPESLKHA
jgi:hypothetical protein